MSINSNLNGRHYKLCKIIPNVSLYIDSILAFCQTVRFTTLVILQ